MATRASPVLPAERLLTSLCQEQPLSALVSGRVGLRWAVLSKFAMKYFSAPTRQWFERTFEKPTRVQEEGWPHLAAGRNALMLAPTGSGKTLAAFLWGIDRLMTRTVPQGSPGTGMTVATGEAAEPPAPGVRLLYISPLKALAYDIERNLRSPLVGIARAAEQLEVPVLVPRIDVRTGDTPAKDRRRQVKDPAEILVTTPESLYLLLTSQAAATLTTVESVIIDEVHAMASTKRGVHLALSLERLAEIASQREGGVDPQRIGLSATVRPPDEAARFLGGDRPVEIVDASAQGSDRSAHRRAGGRHGPTAGARDRSSGRLAPARRRTGDTCGRHRSGWLTRDGDLAVHP